MGKKLSERIYKYEDKVFLLVKYSLMFRSFRNTKGLTDIEIPEF